jgi:histidinol-phosphate aminotransferase
MKNFEPELLARENIRWLTPYSSARSEFAGEAEIFLDANENSNGSPLGQELNRYPDPIQVAVKQKIAEAKGVRPSEIFVGNGSDEAIDLLFRIFCEPRRDEAIICPPTYGMYRVSADINDVPVKEAALTLDFQLDVDAIQRQINESTKLLFICSPNNPTGNAMHREDILRIASEFAGIVVVDEAYTDFSSEKSLIDEIRKYPNLVVLQTFSKAWGLAGLRVGLAFANERVIDLFNRVKPPYNVSRIAQDALLKALENKTLVDEWITETLVQRDRLAAELERLDFVKQIYPTDANFILVKMANPDAVYRHLIEERIAVRNRSSVELCEGCLRITVGTARENECLLSSLAKFEERSDKAPA